MKLGISMPSSSRIHFLVEGLKNDEKLLFVSMTEDIDKIKQNGKKFGFPMDEITFLDLSPKSDFIANNKDYDLFSSSEVEQEPIIDKLTNTIDDIKPDRIFFDGFTQLKYLSSDDFKFRKQRLSFVQFVKEYNILFHNTSKFLGKLIHNLNYIFKGYSTNKAKSSALV